MSLQHYLTINTTLNRTLRKIYSYEYIINYTGVNIKVGTQIWLITLNVPQMTLRCTILNSEDLFASKDNMLMTVAHNKSYENNN